MDNQDIQPPIDEDGIPPDAEARHQVADVTMRVDVIIFVVSGVVLFILVVLTLLSLAGSAIGNVFSNIQGAI